MEYMDINEFVERGFLQEVNRKFFHPLGVALSVVKDTETDGYALYRIWDYRDDPEGIFFAQDVINEEKVNYIEALRLSKVSARLSTGDVTTDNNGIQVRE